MSTWSFHRYRVNVRVGAHLSVDNVVATCDADEDGGVDEGADADTHRHHLPLVVVVVAAVRVGVEQSLGHAHENRH